MRYLLPLVFLAVPASAETIVASQTIRAQAIITMADLTVLQKTIPGTISDPETVVGMEARVVLYPGRPIRLQDIGPPAIIERNQVVTAYYRRGALTIAADARALERAGIGDLVRLMNLASRNTVTGFVDKDGTVVVGGPALAN